MIVSQADKLAERANNRSHVYGLLSCIYKKEPSQKFFRNFKESDLLGYLKEIGIDLDEYFTGRSLLEISDEVSVEYTRLFLGPGKHIYPYESAFRYQKEEGLSDTTSQVENLIKSYGLEYCQDYYIPPDHISVEFEFMQRLTNEEAKAWGEKGSKEAIEFIKIEKEFIQGHLITWIPEFADIVIKQAFLSFYREMAKLTKEYVLLEAQEIENLMNLIRA